MSWLVSSIANSLRLDDDDDDDEDATKATASAADVKQQLPPDDQDDALSPSDDGTPGRGVKDDLSEFSKTLNLQFWGVASFLAPPPPGSQISEPDPQSLDRSESFNQDHSSSAGIAGVRNDLSEIGGRFRTGISKLSSNKAVSEFTKIASNFLQYVSDEGVKLEDYAQRGVIGVTKEVVAYARDVATHPETWLDFPLPDEDGKEDLSDTQQEHALAIEHLAPTLAALRMKLCPGYMSEGSFWKIYFVLVHPRLSRHDAELLSTSQIVRAREMITQELRTNIKSKPDGAARGTETIVVEAASSGNEEHLTGPSNDIPESIPIEVTVIEQDTSMDAAKAIVENHSLASIEIPIVEEASAPENNDEKSSSDISKGDEKRA